MNAAVATRSVIKTRTITTYRGEGYVYHFHKSTKDMTAKLKIGRELLNTFVKRVGAVNSINLPGLYVTEQGGGWYEVFVINPLLVGNVLNFLKRLNRWSLRLAFAPEKRVTSKHYALEIIPGAHTRVSGFRVVAPAQPAPPTALQDMVAKFKAKFGKA